MKLNGVSKEFEGIIFNILFIEIIVWSLIYGAQRGGSSEAGAMALSTSIPDESWKGLAVVGGQFGVVFRGKARHGVVFQRRRERCKK